MRVGTLYDVVARIRRVLRGLPSLIGMLGHYLVYLSDPRRIMSLVLLLLAALRRL